MALQLLIEDFDGAQTYVPLEGDEVTIGRTEGNTIQLTEQNVSRKHARLVADDGEWFVEDLASYNGIRVNGVPTSGRVKLEEGDTLQIGDYNLVLTGASARATLNLDGRAPANQGGITANDAGAASSGSLPRLAAAAPARVAHDTTEEEDRRSGGAGAAIGGVVVAIAACGAVAAWALGLFGATAPAGNGGPAADKAVIAANDTSPRAAEADAGSAAALSGGSEAATGDGTPAAVVAGAATAPAEPPEEVPTETPTGETAPTEPTDTADVPPAPSEKAPTAKSTGSTTTSAKSSKSSGSSGGTTAAAAPVGDPTSLLADARKASLSGDNKTAYKLAKESYAIDKNADALQQMGVSACKMGDEKKARAVYDKLSGAKKSAIEKLCASSGVILASE